MPPINAEIGLSGRAALELVQTIGLNPPFWTTVLVKMSKSWLRNVEEEASKSNEFADLQQKTGRRQVGLPPAGKSLPPRADLAYKDAK
ncbi:hypothetical protein A1355_20565 [Methylomonas koyamae]|uniref:Uncharacterized protein n=2 Tax=Methylococcaceae TaxID=403 RepID=A0A177P2L2_9GAMM|nr:hypothetical protein A1355_20565 [Methylomonas koyamae]